MAFVGVLWFSLFVLLSAATGLTSSKNLLNSTSIELEKMVMFPQEDSKITKRFVGGYVSML